MLDDSGISYFFKDRGSDLDSSDPPEVAETGTPQSPLNSIDNGSFPLSGATEPDDIAAPATEPDTSIAVASSTSLTADTQRAGPLGSLLSADEASEIFGSGTNVDFLILAAGAASQNPLNFFGDGDNPVFGFTSPGAETVQKDKNSAAFPAERPQNLMSAGTPRGCANDIFDPKRAQYAFDSFHGGRCRTSARRGIASYGRHWCRRGNRWCQRTIRDLCRLYRHSDTQ